jgi:hypothetical protein
MAYIQRNLVQLGSQEGKTAIATRSNRAPGLWSYATADAISVVRTSGYFNSAADFLRIGDVIMVTVYSAATFETAAATVSAVQFMVVLSNTGSVVDVSDGTAITLTNT